MLDLQGVWLEIAVNSGSPGKHLVDRLLARLSGGGSPFLVWIMIIGTEGKWR